MPKRRSFNLPVFAPIPRLQDPSTERWLQNFLSTLQQFARDVVDIGADYDLIAHVTRQSLAAGFTITPDSHDIELYSTADRVSDASFAIMDGRSGQTVVLTNTGAFLITLKDNANTKFGEDITLNTNDSIILKWSDTLNDWTIIGSGGLAPTTSRGKIAVGVGNVGAGEDDLWTWTMPANTMVPNTMLSFSAIVGAAANANVKTLKFHLGGSSFVINGVTGAPSNTNIIIEIKAWYTSSTNTIGTVVAYVQGVGLEIFNGFILTVGIDFTTTNVLKLTGTATANNDLVCYHASALIDRII